MPASPPDPGAARGRGLLLVAETADLAVSRTAAGKVVEARVSIQ